MVKSWCMWSWPCNEDEKHCCLWWQILVSWGSGWTGRRGPTWLHFGPWVLLGITESLMLTSWSLVNSLRHFLWTSSCSSKLALGFGVYSHCCAFNALVSCPTRCSLYCSLALCIDHLVGGGNPIWAAVKYLDHCWGQDWSIWTNFFAKCKFYICSYGVKFFWCIFQVFLPPKLVVF